MRCYRASSRVIYTNLAFTRNSAYLCVVLSVSITKTLLPHSLSKQTNFSSNLFKPSISEPLQQRIYRTNSLLVLINSLQTTHNNTPLQTPLSRQHVH